jgi:hypothetical protein
MSAGTSSPLCNLSRSPTWCCKKTVGDQVGGNQLMADRAVDCMIWV